MHPFLYKNYLDELTNYLVTFVHFLGTAKDHACSEVFPKPKGSCQSYGKEFTAGCRTKYVKC